MFDLMKVNGRVDEVFELNDAPFQMLTFCLSLVWDVYRFSRCRTVVAGLFFVVLNLVSMPICGHAADSPERWSWPCGRATPLAILPDAGGTQLLYAAIKEGGLVILKSDENSVSKISGITANEFGKQQPTALAKKGDVLYVGLGDFFRGSGTPAGLVTVNIVDAKAPRIMNVWKSPKQQGATCILIDGDFLYLGAMSYGVLIFDISGPEPKYIDTFVPDLDFPKRNPGRIARPNVRGLAIHGNLLYVCFDAGGLRVLDVTDRGAPREIGKYINPKMTGKQQAYNGIAIDFPFAYLTCDYAGVEVVDISKADEVRQVSWWNPWQAGTAKNLWFNSGGHANQIIFDRRAKRLFVSAGDSELLVLDIKDPLNLLKLRSIGSARDGMGAWSVAIDDKSVYLGYVKSFVPFRGTWSGIKSFSLD